MHPHQRLDGEVVVRVDVILLDHVSMLSTFCPEDTLLQLAHPGIANGVLYTQEKKPHYSFGHALVAPSQPDGVPGFGIVRLDRDQQQQEGLVAPALVRLVNDVLVGFDSKDAFSIFLPGQTPVRSCQGPERRLSGGQGAVRQEPCW